MSQLLKILVILFVVIVVGFFILRLLLPRISRMPDDLGVDDNGRFKPCPDSPNCVSTQATDKLHGMSPIHFTTDVATAQAKMIDTLAEMPNNTIITNEPNYIHAEFRTPAWQFVDDVEFYFDEEAGLIHFRSASRLGYGDGNANRNRMKAFRAVFE